jgi:uncharacterized repeat protein (TIGR01451 family)
MQLTMKRIMNHQKILGIGVLALMITTPLVAIKPVRAALQETSSTLIAQILRPEVKLVMGVEKQVEIVDSQGKTQLSWEQLEGEVAVAPNDVLRYSVRSENAGEVAAQNLVITQPVPEQTVYVLDSASQGANAEATYSIDNGQTFVKEPMVEVVLPDGKVELQPAPASAYTHVRWRFADTLEPTVTVDVNYQVQVK